tara:strand:+ start:84 stop:2162 length:2079 start_codon:yes stop_codon:yes gene_type:complete
MATPLIRTLQAQGGTFYAFTSAARDLSKTLNNDQVKFQFSKFALLNIPDFEVPSQKQNYPQFRTIDGTIFDGLSGDDNINLSQSFQNYALNIESLLLSDDDYDSSLKRTVSERVFFKWLKELGAMRFKEAGNNEKNPILSDKRFVEEDTALSGQRRYQRVVEYVGNIDVSNNVQKAGQTYTEVYINVPSRVGNTPTVLFDAYSDQNYMPDMIISGGNNEYLQGRNSSTIHPDGLSTNAYYDYDAAVSYTDTDANWHGSLQADSYYTQPGQFDDPTSIEITKTQSDYLGSVQPFTDIEYLRSNLDGIGIDFDSNSYTDIVTDAGISTIQEYNSTVKSGNFDFNCVLIYYDVYEPSNPDNRATNLYGVIFLDNLTPTSTGAYIQRLKKIKPNPVTGSNGTAWSLTFNLKFDTSVDNAAIETIINDYSTFSMDLFIDASTQLQEAAKTLIDTQSKFLNVVNRVDELEGLIFTTENVTELKSRVDGLEANIQNASLALSDSTALLDLISKNNDNINDIINGTIPVNLQYNTDVLRAGPGIRIDKSVPNKVKVENKNQAYNINLLYEEDTFETLVNNNNKLDLNQSNPKAYFKLSEFTNMLRVYTDNEAIGNLKLYIDDSAVTFKQGQAIKFVWDSDFNISNKNIQIYTDKLDKFGLGSLGKLVGSVSSAQITSSNPIIEIICLDEVQYDFAVDILR